MKSRPILFSKDMVEAILQGRKTQTRRIIKKIEQGTTDVYGPYKNGVFHIKGENSVKFEFVIMCPYGKKGDILYGRETIWTNSENGVISYNKVNYDRNIWKCTPSIHVPKKHARIWLQITDIRVERLMDISEKDAIAEGIFRRESGAWQDYSPKFASFWCDPIKSYISLWDSINGKDSHKINPWVWVIEFENIGFEKAAMLLSHSQKA